MRENKIRRAPQSHSDIVEHCVAIWTLLTGILSQCTIFPLKNMHHTPSDTVSPLFCPPPSCKSQLVFSIFHAHNCVAMHSIFVHLFPLLRLMPLQMQCVYASQNNTGQDFGNFTHFLHTVYPILQIIFSHPVSLCIVLIN